MGLKTVIASLLPVASREHVLGDLEERGFRLRDVATVLPVVWWSHWVRQWNAPPFVAAGASDSDLRRRALQFAHRRQFYWSVSSSLLLTWGRPVISEMLLRRPMSIDPRVFFLVSLASCLLLFRVLEKAVARRIQDRAGWLKWHRRQLTDALPVNRTPLPIPFRIQFLLRFLRVSFYVLLFDVLLLRPWLWPVRRSFWAVFILEMLVVFQWQRRRDGRIKAELARLS